MNSLLLAEIGVMKVWLQCNITILNNTFLFKYILKCIN